MDRPGFAPGGLCLHRLTAAVSAHDCAHGAKKSAAAPTDGGQSVQPLERPRSRAHQYFTDVELTDQANQPHRFYSDLLHDRVVVITAFYTRCKYSGPIATAKLLQLQDHLGERLGKDVHFLSLTVDPTYDTPSRLRGFAQKLGTRPGWHFLTGSKADVYLAHAQFGVFGPNNATADPDPESHGNNIFLGNLRTGLWKKNFGPAVDTDQLAQELDHLLADK